MPLLESGRRFGSYRIVRSLDAGGMGQIYEAEHVNLGMRCAIKVFSTDSSQREFLRKRFLVEGKILAEFRHPNIVRVTDLAVDEESGLPYFAMDLVLAPDGEPRTLEKARRLGLAHENDIRGWLSDICEGLAYIHSRGVVHRDISLENVMIGPDGHAVITDFGIARILSGDLRKRVEMTKYTMVEIGTVELRMGKAPYLAPELSRKLPAKASPATDAWALGILVFRLLTGFWFERERRANSLEMLVGYEHDWTTLLSHLLDEDPSRRLPESGISEVPRWVKPCAKARFGGRALSAVAVVVLALGALAIWAWFRSVSSHVPVKSAPKELSSGIIGYDLSGEVTYSDSGKSKVIKVPDGVTTITEENLKEWQGQEVILPKSVHTLKIPKAD